jgi:hypothetical protein
MIVLAHGAAGPFDEFIALVALGIFLLLMVASIYTSWRQNRALNANEPATSPESPETESADHYRLE